LAGSGSHPSKIIFMIRYVAFLRGINVAGQKLIKMDDLARLFVSLGFRSVRTYIQSGNVIFDHTSANSAGLRKKIEKAIKDVLDYEVTVVLRPLTDIEAIVARNPFRKIKPGADVVPFVVFLSEDPKIKPKLPLISITENLDVFEVKDRAAFVLCRRKQNGLFGFPNKFVEKELGVPATTRNVNTVQRIAAFAQTPIKDPVAKK
jgi:uncharacterized protein (DUF1697 family)